MMYLLDTNIVSELRKAKSGRLNKNVQIWANSVPPTDLFLSAITILELETGILLLERRDSTQSTVLRTWLDNYVLPAFSDRILPINTPIARQCAKLHVPNPRSDRDALIAATAIVHAMVVVTRNVADFEPTGVQILNPFDSDPALV